MTSRRPILRLIVSKRFFAYVWRSIFIAILLAISVARVGAQSSSIAPEYKVKAAFLFHFAQFVEWPTNAFSSDTAPLIIGILGKDPFGPVIDEIIRGEVVGAHPLQVQRYRSLNELGPCHILFVGASEAANTRAICAKLEGKPVVTVGETENFARSGGIIRFMKEGSKIRFRINIQAAREANVTISSKLLRAAEIVTTDNVP